MMILLFGVLNDEQRALVERIFHEHRVHFQRISFKIVKSEEAAEDVVSTAFVKIMDNIEKISELTCPQMTAFCVTIVKNASIDVLRHSSRAFTLTAGTAFRMKAPMTSQTSAFTMPMCVS